MCLIAAALNHFPGYRLVLLANRDEFHQRPSQSCHQWTDRPVIAGRDLQAGGTWLGVSPGGRVAAVTNYREMPSDSGERSRGELPIGFLLSGRTAPEHAAFLSASAGRYGGFNLLMFDGAQLCWTSNRDDQWLPLDDGVHALSNHLMNTRWPKVRRIRAAVEEMKQFDVGACLKALNDRRGAPDEELPNTGIGLERERFLAPIQIVNDLYGTRCSTLVGVKDNGATEITEVSYDRAGNEIGRVAFELPDCQTSNGCGS